MRSVGFLWVLALLMVHGTLFAGFQFSHQTSTMSIRSAKLIVGTPLTDWDGTLQQSGTITGQPITFADGIFTNNTTPAFFNGVYNGSLNPITLDVNRKLVVNCGSFTPQITVIRGGNVLQGQPLFLNRDSINLTHQLSNLTIGVQAALNSNIVLNQGKVTLSDHLFMGDDCTITGSGTMALNRKRFAFGGKDLHLTHTILWSDANDVVLNSRTQLSGIWTFTGVTARLNGNGNILDLSVGGTIFIKRGTTLHMTDVKIRGLGIGRIIFEDKNSSLRISAAELEVVSNLTFTVGGIYAESCSRIITGNKILTFSEQATLSVDQITLYYDTLTFNDTNNIQPLIGAANNPGGKNVASVNNGTIGHLDSGLSTKVRTNSNALLRLTSNNSQALLSCCKNSSNSIINLNSLIRVNSNASLAMNKNNSSSLLALNRNSSNAILNLNNNIQTANTNIRVNSNAFVSLTTNNSNALLKLFANNSNAILSNASCCRVNSNALLALNKNNSNTLLRLTTNNSEAILNSNNQIRVNSNALLTLATNNSNTLLRLTTNNSQALLYLTKNNSNTILNGDLNQLRYTSNALLACCKNSSNSVVNLNNLIRVNSNASLALNKNNSNALLALNKNNSNSLLALSRNSSNAILNLDNNIQTANSNIRVNSNTLLSLTTNNSNALLRLTNNNSQALLYLTKNNSNSILNGELNQVRYTSNALLACCKNSSNSILKLDNLIRVNSNASLALNKNNSNSLLALNKNNSNSLLALSRNSSNAILSLDNNIQTANSNIRVNSNTLLSLTSNNSNALLRLTANNSQALLYLTKNNSNTILNGDLNQLRYTSNALLACCKSSSNSIVNLNNLIRVNSNASLAMSKNNSNSLLALNKNNSNALLVCCKNSSNSIMNLNNLIRVNSNTLVSLTTNNSNALLRLTANNSQTLVACCKNNSNALISFGRNNSNAIAKLKSQVNCCSLVQAPVAADVLMECNCIVDPVKVINVVNTLTIDGQGAWIEFCSSITPQFIVADGVTVTLQNVTLTRINANTFSLGAGATIVLGENVTFELEDDLTLNGQAFAVGGTIDNPFVWTIRGLAGKRRLTLAPNVAVGQYISLGFNTLLLQNIDLAGVENISITRGVNLSGALVTGALGFGGEAEISLGQDTDTTFVVEGNDNRITMLDTGLALTGFILYSDIFDSELHLSFHVQAPIVGNPSVSFGPDLLFLNSAIGRASIIFDDAWAIVVNQNGNSFVTDAHAFIGGRNVEVNGFPIKQTSAGLVLDSGLNLYSDQPNAIDRSSIRGLQFRSQPRTHVITALDIKRMKEYEQLQDTIEVSSRPQKPKASSNRERQKQNKYGRRNSLQYSATFEKGLEESNVARSFVSTASAQFQILKNHFQEQIKKYTTLKRLFVLPNIFQLEQNGSAVKVENASDNILIHSGGVGLDFGIDPVNQLSLYLGNNVSGNGTVRQGFKDATLKPNDKIFVRSLNNRIQIQEHFTIQGEIVMTPGSELIFEFLDNGKEPVLFFDTTYNSFFDIAHDAQVRFTGRGTVVFGDGFIMRLEGGKLTPEKTRLLFDEGVFVVLGDEGESTVIIDGDGKLLFDRGAQLNIQAGQHLVIGRLDEPTLPPDGIDITLDRGAEWNLNEDVDGDNIQEGNARISVIGSSNFSLRVHDEAKIYIGSQGVLEINALFNERLEVPGVLTNLAFTSKGTLSFENGGQFVLGLNKNFVTTSVDTKKGILQTDGTGVAQFAARNDSVTVRLGNSSVVNQGNAFKGLIQDSGQFIGLKGSCAGRDIIRRLINIVPSLSFSTFFKRGDFSQGIELLGGGGSIQSPMLILELDKNDDVRSDDVIANIVVGFNGSSLLTIDRLGNRQLH